MPSYLWVIRLNRRLFYFSVIKLAKNTMDVLKRIRAGTKTERLREGKRKAKEVNCSTTHNIRNKMVVRRFNGSTHLFA